MAYEAGTVDARRLHLELATRLGAEAGKAVATGSSGAAAKPAAAPARKAPPRVSSLPPKPARPLILICDDEELVLDLLEHRLTGEGYEVMRAADGAIAMECLARRTPAVVILAAMLPCVGGTEILQRIRENPDQRDVPVMMLTHRSAVEDVVEALRLGASDYITKPFLIGEVLERVSQYITPYEHPLDSLLQELAA
jgi:CheY-like chemotaxis protein